MSDIIPINSRSFTFTKAGVKCTLQFDQEYLTWSCEYGPGVTRTSKTPLWRIMPEFVTDRSLSDFAKEFRRRFQYSIAGAVIFFFSEVQRYVPLLAPGLALFAAYNLYRFTREYFPSEKTTVLTEYGEEIVKISHYEELAVEREAFEEALREAILEARFKYYEK